MSVYVHHRGAPEEEHDASVPRAPLAVRLYDIADYLAFVGLVNLLIVLGMLGGGVVLGVAPSFAAAVFVVRARLRGEGGNTARRFFRHWRQRFWATNLLQLPANIAVFLLASNVLRDGWTSSVSTFSAIALGIAVVYQIFLVVMDEHYDLPLRKVWGLAGGFMVRNLGGALLLLATLALVAVVSVLVPGLIPVLSLGAACHLCTALSLSFFTANDRRVAADVLTSNNTSQKQENTYA